MGGQGTVVSRDGVHNERGKGGHSGIVTVSECRLLVGMEAEGSPMEETSEAESPPINEELQKALQESRDRKASTTTC